MDVANGTTSTADAALRWKISWTCFLPNPQTPPAYFLAPYFDGRMSDAELKLRAELLTMAQAPASAEASSAWEALERSLQAMGWDPSHPDST